MFNTPILFIAFNRPLETREAFETIRSIKPRKLYISVDGPRADVNADRAKVNEVLTIVRNVDWDCEVTEIINDKNLGCRDAVNKSLDIFFENEEMGIIIEDDIIGEENFYRFCETMLLRYKDDERVMLVTGNNVLGEYPCETSYFFSKIGAIWGWATWRRAWLLHDKKMQTWPTAQHIGLLHNCLPHEMASEREKICELVFSNKIDTWDYQFTYTRLINSGLSIVPKYNLIKNLGFNESATHTQNKPHYFDNEIRVLELSSLIHPQFVYGNLDFDLAVFQKQKGKKNNWKTRIKNKLTTNDGGQK